jgi:bacteriorhodopsin
MTQSELWETSSVHSIPTIIPNPPIVQEHGEAGEKILWVVFFIMFFSSLVFYFLAWRTPIQKRLFHILTAFITTFATISYFAMATGDGTSSAISFTKDKHGVTQEVIRQIYWARYADWVVTTPLLLLDLALLAGLSGADILVAIVADIVMVLTGLFAAYGDNATQKWGYYVIGCLAYLVVVYELAVAGRHHLQSRDAKTATLFHSLAIFTLILWTLYPVVWGIGDGARKLSVDGEILSYAVLDVLAKPVFGFWLLFSHDRIPSAHLHLDGAWSHGFGKRDGAIRVGEDDEA